MEDGFVENESEASTSKPTQELLNVKLDQTRIIVQQLQNNMKKSFNNSMHSDIDIVIDYKVIKGHKLILSQNPSFRKMFAEAPNLKEILLSDEISDSVESDIKYLFCNEIDHEDKDDFFKFSSEACETFLRYLYATEIEIEKINLDLILVANKFTDDNLKQFCENHLINNVNMQNAIQTLLVSLKTDCEKLKKQACILIARNFCEMKFNEDFNLVLENDEAMSAILDVFDECHVTLITKDWFENLHHTIKSLRSADLLMTVGNYHFLVHKKILSERNAVLKMIINAASTDGFPTSVSIPDVDQNTFKIFLRYNYDEEGVNTQFLNTSDISKELLGLAHKYTNEMLKKDCELEFIYRLNYENVIDSLIIAIEFKCKRLEIAMSNIIVSKYDDIKNHRDFLLLMKNPDAATVIVNTFHERLIMNEPSTHFSNELVFDVSEEMCRKEFQVKNERFVIAIGDHPYVIMSLCRISTESDVSVCCSVELISTTNTQHNISILLYLKSDCNWPYDEAHWREFITWNDLIDPKYGYIKDEKFHVIVSGDII